MPAPHCWKMSSELAEPINDPESIEKSWVPVNSRPPKAVVNEVLPRLSDWPAPVVATFNV